MTETLLVRGTVRATDPEAPIVTAVVSTENVARDGAIIRADGWVLDSYVSNPVVLWGHDDSSRLPIARAISTEVRGNELVQVHEFDDADPLAAVILRKIRAGFINATSVRWRPGETEWRNIDGQQVLVFVRGHELLEVSYVAVPADPGALVQRANGRALAEIFPPPAKHNELARVLREAASMLLTGGAE
jgi:HK97 family phage prohead protease